MAWRTMALVLGVGIALGATRPAKAQDFYPKETESYLINYMVLSKSTTTAWCLSAGPGFGAGHFWAGQTGTGAIMAVGQGVGIALYLVGSSAGLTGSAQTAVVISGGLLFAGFKLADMVLAPHSAELFNRGLAQRLKVKPLAVVDPARPGRAATLAYGLTLQADFGT